jgi:hypothetical protein
MRADIFAKKVSLVEKQLVKLEKKYDEELSIKTLSRVMVLLDEDLTEKQIGRVDSLRDRVESLRPKKGSQKKSVIRMTVRKPSEPVSSESVQPIRAADITSEDLHSVDYFGGRLQVFEFLHGIPAGKINIPFTMVDCSQIAELERLPESEKVRLESFFSQATTRIKVLTPGIYRWIPVKTLVYKADRWGISSRTGKPVSDRLYASVVNGKVVTTVWQAGERFAAKQAIENMIRGI